MHVQLQPVASNYSTEQRIYIDKMHLKIEEQIEWDAAGELDYMIQAAQNMRILYFNALA